MLLRFEAGNHRSILDPVELSMIAVDDDRPAARRVETLTGRVLTIAGIYGPNASGKSNVVEALAWLSAAVQHSLRAWDQVIPREPFKFGEGPASPSWYGADMTVSGIRYTYRVEVDDANVLFEGLYSYPERRRRVLFERAGLDITFRRGLGSLAGTRDLLTPSTLALSAATRLGEPEISQFGRVLGSISVLGPRRPAAWNEYGSAIARGLNTSYLFEHFAGSSGLADVLGTPEISASVTRESALALLRFADLGLDDVRIVTTADNDARLSAGPPRRRVQLLHRAAGQELPFELSEESTGTQTWYALIGPVLSALSTSSVLLVDEIDASLHPRLSARLLELFSDPEINPRGAQLIFTTHDTSLLGVLNRDEVWLAEKGENGQTTLTALAEYGGDKVRRSLNLERAYLQGRFGALPEPDQFIVRQALGIAGDDG